MVGQILNGKALTLSALSLVVSTLGAAAANAQSGEAFQIQVERCSDPAAASSNECQKLGARIRDMIRRSPSNSAPADPTGGTAAGIQEASIDSRVGQLDGVQSKVQAPQAEPSEFQRYISASVGVRLPIFGASLFELVPSTFAPIEGAPVTADYVIGPGDSILVRTSGQVNLNLELIVDRSGQVYLPQVGTLTVTGLTFQQLHNFFKTSLEKVYRNFELTVSMGPLRSIQIFVVGYASRPGTYTISGLSTLVNALFASGGPSPNGSMRRIQLKRGDAVVVELDLYDLLLKGDKSKDVRLLPGDVVFIPPRGPQVAVAGSVVTPAIFELKNERTIGEVLQLAGGVSAWALVKRIVIERIDAERKRTVVEVSLEGSGRDAVVREADIVRVQPIAPKFENTVTLRGNVANPGRFRWRHGMRLYDIMPDKDSLITRGYWTKVNQEGYTPTQDVDILAAESVGSKALGEVLQEINWSYATIERQSTKGLSPELISFHLGRLILERDDSQNLELQPGDVVTVYSTQDIQVPMSQQAKYIRLEGEFSSPGIYKAEPGETLGQIVQRAGGVTRQGYLYASALTRESVRQIQQQQLDRYIQQFRQELASATLQQSTQATASEDPRQATIQRGAQGQLLEQLARLRATGRIVLDFAPSDQSINKLMQMPVENGDVYKVPPRPSTVSVFGAVYNPNTFLYVARRKVADYLREAGCCTRDADKGRMFVLRANGSVIPRRRGGLFRSGNAFGSIRLYPGDAILVPPRVDRGSTIRGLRDWTQIFSQLALGAAAINVIR